MTSKFLFYRFMFFLANKSAIWFYSRGASPLVVEFVGRVIGVRWAFRGMRRMGWHPNQM
jgi:hypothetical protein